MKKINNYLRIAFAAGLLAVLSACGSGVTITVSGNSARVANTASEIANLTPPVGFTPEYSASAMDYTVVIYNAEDRHSHLYLIQSKNENEGVELEQNLKNLASGAVDTTAGLTVVEQRPVTVRGQEVTLVISDGVNSENIAYRQAMVGFQGKGGPALLVFTQPLSQWDQLTVDTLLSSIR